ncbi:uncharacterized protein LOC132547714 [Ylistrum balloti]|uniref:uncharacterized protein LOC132547714 n=1 Tax=Ylistrum balloti TaxID=509963 RepID=UPI002905EE38|nr:uncharacterized protein LOC132547714 [Ylistrum balloti]
MEAVQGSIRKAPQTRRSPRAWRARPAREARHITTVVVRLERGEDLLMLEADEALQDQGPEEDTRQNSSKHKTSLVDCMALMRGQRNFCEVATPVCEVTATISWKDIIEEDMKKDAEQDR